MGRGGSSPGSPWAWGSCAFSGRSGAVEVVRSPRADERSAMIDLRATAFAGVADPVGLFLLQRRS